MRGVKKGFCDRNSSGGFSGFCKGFRKQFDADFTTNKDLLIIPPGQIPPSVLLWGSWCGVRGLILPQLRPTSHSNIHVSMVLLQTLWPTLVPSIASLWLSCTISQDSNPIQCRGSARKGNSLTQPTLTAPGGISSAELTATRLSGDRRETISFTYYQGLHTWLKKMTRKWQSTSFFHPSRGEVVTVRSTSAKYPVVTACNTPRAPEVTQPGLFFFSWANK